jgi:hypothetical protein
MKKIFLLSMLAVTSTAYASKARMIALGEDQYGSYFIEDQRNVFLNAAKMHSQKEHITFEWGSSGATPETDPSPSAPGPITSRISNTDNDKNPIAEGGFFTSAGPTAYGVYFGYEDNRISDERHLASDVSGFHHTDASVLDNALTFFFGANRDLSWGAALTYAKTQDQTVAVNKGTEQQLLALSFGAVKEQTEVNGHINLINKAKDSDGDEFKGKIGLRAGMSHNLGLHKVFAQFRHSGFEAKDATTKPEGSFNELLLGTGREKVVSSNVSLFVKAQFVYAKQKIEKSNFGYNSLFQDVKQTRIPLTAALEAKVLDWLVLRGSVAHNLWAQENNSGKKKTLANSNDINAGASMLFGNFTIDGLIGTGNDNSGTNTTDSSNEEGILSTDNIMTRVSMTYRF